MGRVGDDPEAGSPSPEERDGRVVHHAPDAIDPRGGVQFHPEPGGGVPLHGEASPYVAHVIETVHHEADDAEHVWRTGVGTRYQQLTLVAAATCLLLLAPLVAATLVAQARLDQYQIRLDVRDGSAVAPGALADAGDRILDVWIVWLVSAGVALAALVIWCHRAYTNLAVTQRRFREHWAYLAWFVPPINLWRPQQIVADLWDGSTDAARFPVRIWWIFFVLAPLASLGASWLAGTTDDPDLLVTLTQVSLAAEVSMVFAALAGVLVVGVVTLGQRSIALRYARQAGITAPSEPLA